MKQKFFIIFLIGMSWAAFAWTAHAQVPGIINYQGRVSVNGTNFSNTGSFEFALINPGGSTNYWSNDGTAVGHPGLAVALTVTNGLYSVLLGNTAVPNMTTAISPTVFTNSTVLLRVWFNDGVTGFQQLTPDQRIAAAGYAEVAATVPNGAIGSSQLASNLVVSGQFSAQSISLGNVPFLNTDTAGDCFVGANAGNTNMTGSGNTAVGGVAFQDNTTGSENTAVVVGGAPTQ
jgi:hypothetical protein